MWFLRVLKFKCTFFGCDTYFFKVYKFMILIIWLFRFLKFYYYKTGLILWLLLFLEFYWTDFHVSGIFTIQIQSVSCFLLLWGALALSLSFSRILFCRILLKGCGSGSFDFWSFTGRIFMCLVSLQSKFKVSFY